MNGDALPHRFVAKVGKGVLGVELQMVDLPRPQAVDQRQEGLHRRDLVPADVQHDAAVRKVGPVHDLPAGPTTCVRDRQLIERASGVALTGDIGCGGDDADVGPDPEPVALGRKVLAQRDRNGVGPGRKD